MEIKVMIVPGKIARVDLASGTVLDACASASQQYPDIDWVGLAKDREVRVQNRKYSNTDEVGEGYFGSISITPLNDGEVVLILTKIKGNEAVLTCWIDGSEYALETPAPASTVLAEAAGINPEDVAYILINGEEAELSRLVGGEDRVEVVYHEDFDYEPEPEAETEAEEMTVTVAINNCTVTGRPEDIGRILGIG